MPQQQRQLAVAPPPIRRSIRIKRKKNDSAEPEEKSAPVDEKKPVKNKKQKTATATEKQKPATNQPRGGKVAKEKGKTISVKQKGKKTASVIEHDNHEHDDHHPSASPQQPLTLTDAHVRSLLPGSFFGLADKLFDRGLWSVAHEHNLHRGQGQFATSPDFVQFQQEQFSMFQTPVTPGTQGPFDAELRLWEVLQHRFRCGLDDFFRYGLRPSLPGDIRGYTNYCAKLTAILVHVMWLPDIAHVRWLLQRVVQERVPGHARPLVPAYSYGRPPFVDQARQWGFDVSMRMSLEAESESLSSKTAKTKTKTKTRPGEKTTTAKSAKGRNDPLSRLATASRDAAQAATEAEAELADFLFMASSPRDLWWLNNKLKVVDEPGQTDLELEMEKDDDDEEEDTGENPFGLRICDKIRNGNFGPPESPDEDEEVVVERYGDRRRREDNNARRMERHGIEVSTDKKELRLDQIFFFLQEEDLDRVLQLMAHEDFFKRTGFLPPHRYYTGYQTAHFVHGYGGVRKGEGKKKPLLTCLQCLRKYHQGEHGHDHDHHHDQHHHHDDSDEGEEEEYAASGDVNVDDGHGHFLFQNFVRDVNPDRALEWLLHKKCEWLLAGCREGQIRSSLESDKDNDLVLPDIPPFDPPPLAAQDRVFTHSSQLGVLERIGEVPHASVMWCLGRGEVGVEGK